MNNIEYSEKEIEYVVKAFKNYMKKIVKHSAIDYARKFNSDIVKEVAFTDSVDRNMSLSLCDSDYFFADKVNLEDNISNSELRVAIKKLSKDEKEIAKIMGLSEKTIRNKKCIIRSKIKRMLGEWENGDE